MKLPKQLKKDNVEEEVRAILERARFELYSNSNIYIPVLQLNPELRKNIFYAKSLGELIIGYEAVEKSLANERKGLQNVDNQSERVSRLLIVTNDGSPRFYRELTFLQNKQGGRVLICRLDVDSFLMADILGLKDKAVKAVLVNRKNSVVNVLKSVAGVGGASASKPAGDAEIGGASASKPAGDAGVGGASASKPAVS